MSQNILKKEAKNADISTEKASSVLKLSDFYSEKKKNYNISIIQIYSKIYDKIGIHLLLFRNT